MIKALFAASSCSLLVGLAASLLLPVAVAQETPADFTTQATLTLSGEGPWYRLEVPMALRFAARYADLRDVRVFNSEGQAQAYALTLGRAEQQVQVRQTAVKWFPVRGAKDGSAEAPSIRVQRSDSGTLVEVLSETGGKPEQQILRGWLLDASAIKAPLEQLLLDWSSDTDGFQRFSIEASDDLQHWQSWGDGQIARLAFADEQLQQRSVKLPGQSARYLRLLWQAPQQAPQLLAAELSSSDRQAKAAPIAWSATLPANNSKPGEYLWELPLALPLERVKITLPQTNTLAPVTLYGRRDGTLTWQVLNRSLLYRLPLAGKESLQEQIDLYGSPVQQLKLVVDERGGGLGTVTPQITVGLRATELVFLARGTPPYQLALGNPTVQAANLPLSMLIPGYEPARLSQLGVASAAAAIAADAAAEPQASAVATTDWKRIGLWAVLLLGVGLLVLMAMSVLRSSQAKS